ncbi:Oidioi.mRNA.OKI2018_I69.chr2.g4041.t1.cds [Oikopleura dioica]|uniref:Oidioi.mRNA.OKI2018_I69.chr2.g4041.t1.cds n=1 Tax=Oikopleura dioica TaxID=34765 RepID=A0ABN7T1K9_OIKDI|nr:Oidioi.mRNA.OKI2018_I69.chr2.g4041.t1.cds [Oikopleura dioica]
MEGSIEDALKGLEKVHKTLPKPPQSAKASEKKTTRKPKIFKGESYKRQQQGRKFWYEKEKVKKPEKPLGSIGSFFGTSDAI